MNSSAATKITITVEDDGESSGMNTGVFNQEKEISTTETPPIEKDETEKEVPTTKTPPIKEDETKNQKMKYWKTILICVITFLLSGILVLFIVQVSRQSPVAPNPSPPIHRSEIAISIIKSQPRIIVDRDEKERKWLKDAEAVNRKTLEKLRKFGVSTRGNYD